MTLSLKSIQFILEFLNSSNMQIAIKDVEQVSADIIQVKNELLKAIHTSQTVPTVPATVETTTTTTTDTK